MTQVKYLPMLIVQNLRRIRLLICVLFLGFLVTGCATQKEVDETIDWSAERLYQDAKDNMADGGWDQAIKQLQRLESRYPFGVYSQQAQMDLAYAHWKNEEPAEALAAIDRFQRLHPNHPGTAYMLYLKGLISFYKDSHFLANLTDQDPSERDPRGARDSFDAFNELVSRFPDSTYAADARERMFYLVNAIASNEIYVARFYFRRGAYVAAINRAQTVVTDFQGTPAIEEALYIMYISYEKLGNKELQESAKRVLDANFPNTKFYETGIGSSRKAWWKL